MEIPEEVMREMYGLSESYVHAMKVIKTHLTGWCGRGAITGLYHEFCLQLHAIPGASTLVIDTDPQQAGEQLYELFCAQVREEAKAMVESVIEATEGGA